jgi:hypothetical protein
MNLTTSALLTNFIGLGENQCTNLVKELPIPGITNAEDQTHPERIYSNSWELQKVLKLYFIWKLSTYP